MSSSGLLASASAALSVLADVVLDPASYRALTESELLELTRLWAEHARLSGTHGALAAGEIAARSARELGSAGLAQRTGHRTPEELVRATTGSTTRDAVASVRAGRIAHETVDSIDLVTGEVAVPVEAWLRPVGIALTAGSLSVPCAEAIRSGLGSPTAEIPASVLAEAAARLVAEAIGADPETSGAEPGDPDAEPRAARIDADRLYRRARELRDEIDAVGIADRETARRNARSLRFRQCADGMSKLIWDLDPESAATVRDLYDRATSPRRGGPRFISGTAADTADRILTDSRSTEQIASDTFLQLLDAGANADTTELLGSGGAVVSILVTADALDSADQHAPDPLSSATGNALPTANPLTSAGSATSTGTTDPTGSAAPIAAGFIAGQSVPVSIGTVQRLLCGGASVPIVFDADGQPLDLGREQRLFSPKQRKALAARDGGCTMTGCDRPASWTEAHHIQHWGRDRGSTDIADGILLCKHHHLLFHNNGWEITRTRNRYSAIPPASLDPDQTPIPLHSKSPAYRDLQRQRAG